MDGSAGIKNTDGHRLNLGIPWPSLLVTAPVVHVDYFLAFMQGRYYAKTSGALARCDFGSQPAFERSYPF